MIYCLPPDGHPLVGGDCVFVEKQTKLMINFFLIVTMIILILSITYNICLDTYNDKKFLLLR